MKEEDLKDLLEILQKITQAIDALDKRVQHLEGGNENAVEKGVQ